MSSPSSRRFRRSDEAGADTLRGASLVGGELILAPAGFFARGGAPHAAPAPLPAPSSRFLTRFSPRIPARSLLFPSAEASMRGDTRFWPSLIALTFVAVSGLSVSDGRSHASSPVSMDTDLFRAIARRQNPVVVAILTTARRETPSPQDIERFERVFGWPLPEEFRSTTRDGIGLSHQPRRRHPHQ